MIHFDSIKNPFIFSCVVYSTHYSLSATKTIDYVVPPNGIYKQADLEEPLACVATY